MGEKLLLIHSQQVFEWFVTSVENVLDFFLGLVMNPYILLKNLKCMHGIISY